jgi:uncharacterized membrane protein YphA (DoxX/SURF4 family)
MDLLLLVVPLIIGGVLYSIIKPKAMLIYKVAWAFIFLSLFISTGSWLFYCAGINNAFIHKALLLQLSWVGSIGHLMLGYLLMDILIGPTSAEADNYQKKINSLTLWGITILTGFSFITESYWKAENCCKMMTFFSISGYNTWFLYFIMAAEAIGGIGVLLHFKLKTGPVAAAGLMLIMIGALYTHNHNNDPFSDSYPALSQFIMLAIMQALYYFEQQGNAMQISSTQQSNFKNA